MGVLLGELVIRQELFEVSGQQFLLHRETHPGSGLPYVCLNLPNVLNVPGKTSNNAPWVFGEYFL